MKESLINNDILPIKKSSRLPEVKKSNMLELQLADQEDLYIVDYKHLPNEYGMSERDKGYNKRYQKHLYNIFKTIFSDYETPENTSKIISWILNDVTFYRFFIPAVTHITSESDPRKNYETLEFIGDSLWKFAFKDYLLDRYPRLTAEEGTNLNNRYMEKFNQAVLGKILGLYNFLIADKYIIDKGFIIGYSEDLFESFAGAVVQSLKLSGKSEYSLKFSKYFLKKVFDKYEFNLTSDVKPPKTSVKEIFQKLNNPKEGIKINESTYMEKEEEDTFDEQGRKIYKISIVLDNESKNSFKKLGYNFPRVLVSLEGLNKKKLNQDAWLEVLKVLEKAGITQKFLEKKSDKEYKEIDPRYSKMLEKVSKDYDIPLNEVDVILNKNSNVGSFQVYQLVLRRKDNHDITLAQMINEEAKNKKSAIKYLLDDYFLH